MKSGGAEGAVPGAGGRLPLENGRFPQAPVSGSWPCGGAEWVSPKPFFHTLYPGSPFAWLMARDPAFATSRQNHERTPHPADPQPLPPAINRAGTATDFCAEPVAEASNLAWVPYFNPQEGSTPFTDGITGFL